MTFAMFLMVKRDNSCVPILGLDSQRDAAHEVGSFRGPEGQTESVSSSSMKQPSLTEAKTNCAFGCSISMQSQFLHSSLGATCGEVGQVS